MSVINKGAGAGGAKTNINGLNFEEKTSIEPYLINKKYNKKILNNKNKYNYYYELIENGVTIIYFKKSGFKKYFEDIFNIKNIYREPDEAFLIIKNNSYYVKILEKKNQNRDGSIIEKLKTGRFNIKEYELMLNTGEIKFNINYTFCVNKYLENELCKQTEKYINFNKILKEDNINIFYGDNDDYFEKIYKWIITI